jgi:hypothetical protein
VWMIKWCFGWRVEQEKRATDADADHCRGGTPTR